MKILHLGHNKEKYLSGYYYQDYIRLLQWNHEVFCYGQNYPGYDPRDRIDDVYQKTGGTPNLIVVGASWERDDHPTEFDPHPAIQLDQVDLPKVMFLNKEYKKLDQKYVYIEKNGISLVLTVLRSVAFSASIEGVRFLHFPFPVNIDLFKDYATPQPADFGFSGAMDRNPLRQQIRDYLNRPEFQGLKLYWAEWGSDQITSGEQYARVINLCKVYLSTPSCHGIVSPRHFEVMACRRLLLCSGSDEYQGLFEPGVHCVTFSDDLSDFREKLFWLLEDHEARERIATQGYEHARSHHSIEARARTFENALGEVFSLTV